MVPFCERLPFLERSCLDGIMQENPGYHGKSRISIFHLIFTLPLFCYLLFFALCHTLVNQACFCDCAEDQLGFLQFYVYCIFQYYYLVRGRCPGEEGRLAKWFKQCSLVFPEPSLYSAEQSSGQLVLCVSSYGFVLIEQLVWL